VTIELNKFFESITFLSPLKNMEEIEHVIERRQDPLSGRFAIGSNELVGKGQFFFGPTDHDLIEKVARESRENCFFCPENVEGTTPRYTGDWLAEGCLKKGECILFPNLFPVSAVHAVVALGRAHYRKLDDFPADLLEDGLSTSVEFCKSLYRAMPENKYFTINSNYLFPAGASLVHPHMQIFGGKYPASITNETLEACRRFFEDEALSYFDQLLKLERQLGQRYVIGEGPLEWLTPFAPMGTNEVLGIVPGCQHLLMLSDQAIAGLANGISKVLAFYSKMDFSTFNFSIYSAPLDGSRNFFPVFIRIICRQNVRPNYRTDDYFIQKLLGEELMLTLPEDLARNLKDFW